MTSTETLMAERGAGRGYWLKMALIIVAAALLYLAGNGSVHLWDRDEAWYCQTSKQMVQSGDWVVPRYLEQPRTAKPILIYWLQATSMSVFGPTVFAARLVSAAAMVVTLIVLATALGRAVGARRAMWTVLIFATSALVIATAKMCLIDSALLVLVSGMQICVFRLYRASGIRRPVGWGEGSGFGVWGSGGSGGTGERGREGRGMWGTAVVLWVLAGLAVLAKGPAPIVVVVASMLVLAALDVGKRWRSLGAWGRAVSWWRTTRPLMGILIVLIVAGAWAMMAWVREPQFLKMLLGEPGRHLTSNQSGHMQRPGYFLATIWVMYFPWSLFLPAALVLGFKHRAVPHIRYALAIVLGNWVFAEMMVTKLPHYMLPSYASLAFLTATALIRYLRHPMHRDLRTAAYKIGVGIWGLGGVAMACSPWVAVISFKDFSYAAAGAFSVAGVVYVGVACRFLYQRRLAAAAVVMGLGMIGLIGILYLGYLPRAEFLRLPIHAGAAMRQLGATAEGQVIMIGYEEPSFAYYQGGTIREMKTASFVKLDPESWPPWIVATPRVFDRLPAECREMLEVVQRLRGMNYNTSRNVTELLILRKRAASSSRSSTSTTQP